MATENSELVKKILLDLAVFAKVKGIKGLADYIGEKPTRVYGWIRNGTIADTGKILTKFPKIDYNWLKTGTGEMFAHKNDRMETSEPEMGMVRNYRELAEMDADTMGEIQTWINDMEKYRPGFRGWFRLEFQNRFPEFDDWKTGLIKKRGDTLPQDGTGTEG